MSIPREGRTHRLCHAGWGHFQRGWHVTVLWVRAPFQVTGPCCLRTGPLPFPNLPKGRLAAFFILWSCVKRGVTSKRGKAVARDEMSEEPRPPILFHREKAQDTTDQSRQKVRKTTPVSLASQVRTKDDVSPKDSSTLSCLHLEVSLGKTTAEKERWSHTHEWMYSKFSNITFPTKFKRKKLHVWRSHLQGYPHGEILKPFKCPQDRYHLDKLPYIYLVI